MRPDHALFTTDPAAAAVPVGMKLAAAAVVLLVATTAATPRARSCGVPDFGATLAEAIKGLAGETEPVAVPMIELGTGDISLGEKSLDIGVGWGTHQTGGLFPGTDLTRIMVGAHWDGSDLTSLSATYGWYTNALGSLALDLGAEAVTATQAIGPTARLLLGAHGMGVRFSGAAVFGDHAKLDGSIELVVDVMDLTAQI